MRIETQNSFNYIRQFPSLFNRLFRILLLLYNFEPSYEGPEIIAFLTHNLLAVRTRIPLLRGMQYAVPFCVGYRFYSPKALFIQQIMNYAERCKLFPQTPLGANKIFGQQKSNLGILFCLERNASLIPMQNGSIWEWTTRQTLLNSSTHSKNLNVNKS